MDYKALPRTVRAHIKTTILKYRFNLELALKRIEEHEKKIIWIFSLNFINHFYKINLNTKLNLNYLVFSTKVKF